MNPTSQVTPQRMRQVGLSLYGAVRTTAQPHSGTIATSGLPTEQGRENVRIPHTRLVPVVAPLAVGLLLGLAGPIANKWDNPACVALGLAFSGGWSWACFAFLVGYFRRSKIESTVLASLGLTVGVLTYYLTKSISPTLPAGMDGAEVVSSDNSSGVLFWGLAAFIIGGPLGFFGNVARTSDIYGLLFRLIVPLVAFIETSMRLTNEADDQSPVTVVTWTSIRFIAVAVALALVGHWIWGWRRARHSRSSRLDDPARKGVTPT
ncbi:DUF6518 family protein [Streptomyces sp. NPDC048258]|uniref:DUF6518 family protein n=1 Tax=Streptomyces sp. NPDC048258 TaxID=3365527 RepID=UPI00371EA575